MYMHEKTTEARELAQPFGMRMATTNLPKCDFGQDFFHFSQLSKMISLHCFLWSEVYMSDKLKSLFDLLNIMVED